MASVFLSYSREDVSRAQAVASALERHGHSVWWDRQLHGGSRFSQEIEQALKRADAIVVLWSRASVQSAWVQDEATEGRDTNRLVPAVIDDSKPPLGFRQYQAVDLSRWKGRAGDAAIEQVHQAIAAKAEATPQAEARPAATRPRRDSRRIGIAAAAISAIAIAIAFAALLYVFAWPAGEADQRSLRLRLGNFASMSKDVPQTVPDTFREEMLSALGTDGVVITTTDDNPAQDGGGFALNASVRKVGDLLRFSVHVVNERTGVSVWSETLDRSAEPMELAPRQAAVSVSQILRCGLGGAARYGKPMPVETLSLYFNFCEEYWADTLGKESNPTRALDLARRVVAAAPDFSRGWSGLGQVAMWASRENRLIGSESLRSDARSAAERAIDLDEENSQAYEVLASLQPPFAFAEREKLHEKAVSVRPGDCGCEYVGYGAFLNRVGRNGEAVDALKRAHDMIPLSADVNSEWAGALFVAGQAGEAQQVVDKLLEHWPDNADLREILVRSAFWTGRYDDALKLLDDPKTSVSQAELQALRMAVQGLRSGSDGSKASAVQALTAASAGSSNERLLITALAALGAQKEALALAASAIQRDGPRALPVLFEPPMAAARRTPQFAQIAQRFRLIDYWRQSRHLPDFCRQQSRPELCARL